MLQCVANERQGALFPDRQLRRLELIVYPGEKIFHALAQRSSLRREQVLTELFQQAIKLPFLLYG